MPTSLSLDRGPLDNLTQFTNALLQLCSQYPQLESFVAGQRILHYSLCLQGIYQEC
jgi:hypothetical protein